METVYRDASLCHCAPGLRLECKYHVVPRNAGATEPRSMVLTEDEEAAVVAFRRHALLALDDCL